MLYNGQPVDLTPEQEEVATMFAVMKGTDYATKKTYVGNFFADWRKLLGENHVIKKFRLCDFTPIYEWHLREKEKKRQMTSEEKKALREEKMKLEEKYMWALVDGVKEKVGNFRVEPPDLFRGRGDHPTMGRLKRRIQPSDITINIGQGAPLPECSIPGQSWKKVKHDNTLTWLASWNDPISQKDFKYVFLAASSALTRQNDKEKYEMSRKLKGHIQKIRENYTKDFECEDMTWRQIAVATYLIDKLAFRAGNEKLHEGTEDGTVEEKVAVYQRANREVAIICNHQCSVSKSHESQMTIMNENIEDLKAQMDELKAELSKAKKGMHLGSDEEGKSTRNLAPEAIEKISTLEGKIRKMETDKKIKEDLTAVALGTPKIKYLDPRITVAWCKRHEVPFEKIFNKCLIAKFGWAMEVDPEFRF